MLKVEIVLNEDKILEEEKNLEVMWLKIDNEYTKYGLKKINKGVYIDAGRDSDWMHFGKANIALAEKRWFTDYVVSWLWFNSDDGKTEDDFVVEDIITEHAKAKRELVI